MRRVIVACLSWYDEPLPGLHACVSSLAGVADRLLAVDGAYAHYPTATPWSAPDQHDTLAAAAHEAGVELESVTVDHAWVGDEVAKRAFMMERAVELAEGGWLLVIDGDELVAEAKPDELRAALAETAEAVCETGYLVEDLTPSRLRRLFRALPGLTVRGRHFRYVVGDRGLWTNEKGQEAAADVTELLALRHRPLRTDERQHLRSVYYLRRNELGLES